MKNINNVIARAQRMMLDENWNHQVEAAAAVQAKGMNGGGRGNDLAMLEQAAFGTTYSGAPTRNVQQINPNYMQQTSIPPYMRDDGKPIQILQETQAAPIDKSKSRIPKAIIESFQKTPAMSGDIDSPLQAPFIIPEQAVQMPMASPQVPVSPVGGVIDYNYIKYLIDESIKANLKQINEGATLPNIRGMKIGNDSVIQFLDTKGNLYEGKLVLKKKANK